MTIDRCITDKPLSAESPYFVDCSDTTDIGDSNIHRNSSNTDKNNRVPSINLIKTLWTFIGNKYERLRYLNLHIAQWKYCGKKLRKSFHLNKSPKRKGYGRFLTDEEKRWLDEYANWSSEMSARIGIPYDCRPTFV